MAMAHGTVTLTTPRDSCRSVDVLGEGPGNERASVQRLAAGVKVAEETRLLDWEGTPTGTNPEEFALRGQLQ